MVEFWYDFASPYSYPAAMRVEALAEARGFSLVWRPFLLGPLFAKFGWRDSPFNLFPAKGRYMWRDMERICASLDLPLVRPAPFPQASAPAARAALALEGAARAAFSKRVFLAEFGQGRAISDRAVLTSLLSEIGAEAKLAAIETPDIKRKLRVEVDRAEALGLPGAPCLVTDDGEVFWGNDRLEQGFDWATGKR